MREFISHLMLTMDEVWLSHADQIRLKSAPSLNDVRLENALFEVEAVLQKAQTTLPLKTRPADGANPPPLTSPIPRSRRPEGRICRTLPHVVIKPSEPSGQSIPRRDLSRYQRK